MDAARTQEPAELLRRYAESGDEAAFAAIVERFKGLVFSAARRRLGSVQLAEEATQTTFAIVARKARSLQKVTHHAAWMHRTATQVARTVARTEARHQKKMKALIEHGELGDGEDPDAWLAVHPYLDEALEALPERDRHVVMLRYFEGLSFREVGERLGKTEAAVQRQGHRALEKLARRLRGKGAAAATVFAPCGRARLPTIRPCAGRRGDRAAGKGRTRRIAIGRRGHDFHQHASTPCPRPNPSPLSPRWSRSHSSPSGCSAPRSLPRRNPSLC